MQKTQTPKPAAKPRAKDKNTEQMPENAIPTSFKKFRQLPEIESFYRFIFENDLRKEAKQIISKILLKRKAEKTAAAKAKRKAATIKT